VTEGATVYFGHGAWIVASVTDETSLVIATDPEDDVPHHGDYVIVPAPKQLGFAVKLENFRITYHDAPVHYLGMESREGGLARLRMRAGGSVKIPGTGWRLEDISFMAPEDEAVVRVTMKAGAVSDVPAKVGPPVDLGGGVTLNILRYEPSFRFVMTDRGREIMSDSLQPRNPAVLVQIVRGGEEGRPSWHFANQPSFGRGSFTHHGNGGDDGVELLYLHPLYPVLRAEARGPERTTEIFLAVGAPHPIMAPWDQELGLHYLRNKRIKEYESQVEVLEDGKVVKRHLIRVNSPLVYKGTKFSQSDYDERRHLYTVLGVSRDWGVWFVYAGFLAGVVGVMGRFYLAPVLKSLRASRRAREESSDEQQ
jgi:hypothetical protein